MYRGRFTNENQGVQSHPRPQQVSVEPQKCILLPDQAVLPIENQKTVVHLKMKYNTFCDI